MRLSLPNNSAQRASALSVFVLFAPAVALAALGVLAGEPARWYLLGTAAATLVLALLLTRHFGVKALQHTATAFPAVAAIACIWLTRPDPHAASTHFAMAAMLAIASGTFAVRAVLGTGAVATRRARSLASRLAARTSWPAKLSECRTLPEVKALREVVIDEAGPVMALLTDKRPQLKIAALGALEYRKAWRVGQPDLVLKMAQSAAEPEVRCAALLALGGVQHRMLIEAMGESLRDPDANVRRAATEAILWDCERRWIWVRNAVREALADPRLTRDGPLALATGTYSAQAVSDLAAWAMESGNLGTRATQSLSLYYSQKLEESLDPKLISHLYDLVAHPRASTVLRVELAMLLQKHGHLSESLILRLVEPTNPSPLRLMAVEAMMQSFPSERAVDVLRDVARQPNRELALAAAIVVQKYLHVDLGLALGEPPPALQSREAAEVTRRVIEWARQGAAVVAAPAVQTQASGW